VCFLLDLSMYTRRSSFTAFSLDAEPVATATMWAMDIRFLIALLFVTILPAVVVGAFFVWAAKKDGEEDEAVQRRLGIRRRTRLGR
jgi:hypothetical protein